VEATRSTPGIQPRDVVLAAVVWPLAALMMLGGLVALFGVAVSVAEDPHRTLWRIALFVLAGLVALVALPAALFLRSFHRGDPKVRQLNWFAGTVVLTATAGVSVLLVAGVS
jgi:hypothetical protein